MIGEPTADFYPRSPCGERLFNPLKAFIILTFLSTLSLRRATVSHQHLSSDFWNFYPRSPCGERLPINVMSVSAVQISIHALLAESDLRVLDGSKSSIISIHALLAESDCTTTITICTASKFLSTLSLRRATDSLTDDVSTGGFLSTLSLRRATAKVHKTVGHFCAYETNFMGIASSC